jgi:hypothetical protein
MLMKTTHDTSMAVIRKIGGDIEDAIRKLAITRKAFRKYGGVKIAGRKWLSGNDNIVGDIGEYWATKLLRKYNPELAGTKVSEFDFWMDDPEGKKRRKKVSVKTLTDWSKSRQGSRVKATGWEYFFAIDLNLDLIPRKYALIKKKDFLKEQKPGTAFRWWRWLRKYEKPYPKRLLPRSKK